MVEKEVFQGNDDGKAAPEGLNVLDAYGSGKDALDTRIPMTPTAQTERNLNEATKFSLTDGSNKDDQETPRFLRHDVADAASSRDNIGQLLWDQGRYKEAVANGKLSAAASVSEILQQTGVPADTASVKGLDDQLRSFGWTEVPISEARPGDVVIGLGAAGRGGDAGIVGADGKIYASKTFAQGDDGHYGHWSEASPNRLSVNNARWQEAGSKLFVLRAPDTCNE